MADEYINVRIRLQDARRFAADAGLDAAAIRGISTAADSSAAASGRAGRASLLHSQALYTLRRASFAATVALVGVATGATVMGIRFNSTMEQNQISMAHFLGSTQSATRELNTLYTLAAQTPFEFPQLTSAATRFLAFGFSLRETNADLRVIGDTAAGLGAGAEGIDRLVLVFGQMHATGRVLGNDLLQLAQLGVPALQILQKQLGLTADQMRQLQQGNLVLPSNVAIPALIAGLREQFGGLSKLQAQSFQGLTSTAHDYLAQLTGIVTHPLFVSLERDLRRINPLIGQLGASFKAGGWDAMIATLDRGVGAGGHLVTSWQQLRAIGQDLWRLVIGVGIPSLKLLWATIGLGSPPMRLLVGLLGVATRHMTLLRIVIGLLVVRYAYLKIVTLGAAVATRAMAAAQWLLNIAMDANPIGLLIVGAVALGVGLGYLVLKVHWFRQAFVDAFNWIKSNWPLLLAILGGPVTAAAYLIVRHFDMVKEAVRGALNWIIRGWDSLHFRIPGFHLGPVHFPGITLGTPHIPLLQTGGVIRQTGLYVGHAGETVIPKPARVDRLPAAGGLAGMLADALNLNVLIEPAPVIIDGQKVTEITFKQVSAAMARA